MNINKQQNKYLIIICCGDNSKHLSYGKIPVNQFFDIMCVYFGKGDREEDFRKHATYFYRMTGCKWTLITHALQRMQDIDLFARYRYIWLPDDDLEIDSEKVKMLFLHADYLGIHLGQPAVIPHSVKKPQIIGLCRKYAIHNNHQKPTYREFLKKSPLWKTIHKYISHIALMPQQHKPHLRIVTNIEVMCPVMSSRFLHYLTEHIFLHPVINNGDIKSGWALESIWRHHIYKFDNPKMIVFDYIIVKHTKTLSHQQSTGTFYQQFNNEPFKEREIIIQRHNKIYGSTIDKKDFKFRTLKTINITKHPQFNFKRVNIGFIHTPKTGGTALKTLLATFTSDNHVEKVFLKTHNNSEKIVWMILNGHSPARYLKPTFNLAFIIGVIRDPYERFTSAFHYNKERGKTHPRQDLIVEVKELHKFLKPINTMEELLSNNNVMKKILSYNHFKPLSHWIMDGSTCLAQYIIDQATFAQDVAPLFSVLGITNNLSRVNVTSTKTPMTSLERTLFDQYYQDDITLYKSLSSKKDAINAKGLKQLHKLLA